MCLVEPDQGTVAVINTATPYFDKNVHMFIAVLAGIFSSCASLWQMWTLPVFYSHLVLLTSF